MKIQFINSKITDNGTVFDVPHGSKLNAEFHGTTVERNGTFLNERDPASIRSMIGLPEDTPSELIVECLRTMAFAPQSNHQAQTEAAHGSRLMKWLEGASNASTVLSNLIGIVNNGAAQQVIEALLK